MEQAADAAVAGEKATPSRRRGGDLELGTQLLRKAAIEEVGGLAEKKWPVVEGENEQRDEQGEHRQLTAPATSPLEGGLKARRHARGGQDGDRKAHHLLRRRCAPLRQGERRPQGTHRSARMRARSAALDWGAPRTWRA